MILPTKRDQRFVTVRRGGTLSDSDHHALSTWAALCAEHVLALFERECPGDSRPREAIETALAWVSGEATMREARAAAGRANAAAATTRGAARYAAYAAAQAAVVAHVSAHALGAAAYAVRAVQATDAGTSQAAYAEVLWQRTRLDGSIRDLVLDDQRLRNALCWYVFSAPPQVERSWSIDVGTHAGPELAQLLSDAGVELNAYATEILHSAHYRHAGRRRTLLLDVLSPRSLGFDEGATTTELLSCARALGWRPAPWDVAPYFRLAFTDQIEEADVGSNRAPQGSITVLTEPLAPEPFPKGFYLRRRGGKLWLRGYACGDDHRWSPDDALALCRRP